MFPIEIVIYDVLYAYRSYYILFHALDSCVIVIFHMELYFNVLIIFQD